MKKFLPIIVFAGVLVPSLVLAQDFKGLVERIVRTIQLLFPLIGGMMLLVFFWGVVRYVFFNTQASTKTADKAIMTWGLVGMFVAFSVWGLVRLLTGLIGVTP
jgi:hypothetical protein